MSSILPNIYDLLEAMTVTYVDKNNANATPTVDDQDEIKGSYATADLPRRLLMPISGGTQTLQVGNMGQAQWVINDLFLLAPVNAAEGGYIHMPILTRYMVAYAAAIANKWQMLYQWQAEAFTTNVTYTAGKFVYPEESNNVFWGVMVSVTITEVI